jgi:hypothetical protein
MRPQERKNAMNAIKTVGAVSLVLASAFVVPAYADSVDRHALREEREQRLRDARYRYDVRDERRADYRFDGPRDNRRPVVIERTVVRKAPVRVVERPVYVERKVVVERPVYVDRPVYVERPVYAEQPVYGYDYDGYAYPPGYGRERNPAIGAVGGAI